jgi:hypothetical protein
MQSSFLAVIKFPAVFVFVMDGDQVDMRIPRVQSSPGEFSLPLTLQDGESFTVPEVLALLPRLFCRFQRPVTAFSDLFSGFDSLSPLLKW